MTETRKLAAILVADVVGYSRLAGADEDRTLARLRGLRSDLVDPAIAAHHGRIVKRTGDGSIIEFRSVVDAVRCAIEVQNGLIERNAGLPPEKRIEFRVGIHVGDVVEESDGDLMGDGVNIAARLEGIANPGAICLSEQAYWQVKQRLDLKVSDLGSQSLKNIAEPVHVYSLEVGDPTEAKPLQSTTSADATKLLASKRRVGTTPLAAAIGALVLLAAASGWFLRAGLQRDAIRARPSVDRSAPVRQSFRWIPARTISPTALPRISPPTSLASAAPASSRATQPLPTKAKASTPRNSARSSEITATCWKVQCSAIKTKCASTRKLVDAESGGHLWAERFDKPLSNLFGMLDDIVARLASQLGAELITHEARRAERVLTPDLMDLYFQGMSWFNKGRNPADTARARDFFEHALALDPDNLDAAIGIADADVRAATRELLRGTTRPNPSPH